MIKCICGKKIQVSDPEHEFPMSCCIEVYNDYLRHVKLKSRILTDEQIKEKYAIGA